ncbi:Hsp20/alpha crystallin family protein [Rhodococcus wratislaviensis]|uniref:Hsp20/alpha crystallin family protein n=1 Tax=Rhodococcus wratislaviensis TaxID=44752 RepID=UPI003666E479
MRRIRVEEQIAGECYLVRAGLPGLEIPTRDVTVEKIGRELVIEAQRNFPRTSPGRSQFRYGCFELPVDVREDDVTATYDGGIVTISCPVALPSRPRIVPVVRAGEPHPANDEGVESTVSASLSVSAVVTFVEGSLST